MSFTCLPYFLYNVRVGRSQRFSDRPALQELKENIGIDIRIYMKKLLIVLIALTFVASAALAGQKDYGSVEVKEVTSIYDGDTFRVNIKDYPALIGERISIRVGGIDTPEVRGKCEQEKIYPERKNN